MKKVLLVGKINEIIRSLNDALSAEFMVQLSSIDANTVLNLIDMVKPDAIVMSLIGSGDFTSSLFEGISRNHKNIPVITIGSQVEVMRFSAYYISGQFMNLTRPVDNNDVLTAVRMKTMTPIGMGEQPAAPATPSLAEMAELLNMGGDLAREKKTVMIVDDNAGTLRSLKNMLDAQYDVVVCTSGVKALTMIGQKHPDLILLDYEMPVCDGKQTLEMIRADDDIKDIPVIFLTGVDDRSHIQAVLALRPAGYMLKPPVAGKLYEAIEKALKK